MLLIAWDDLQNGQAAANAANQYGATFPFLADPNQVVLASLEVDWGIPSYHLIAPGMELVAKDNSNAVNMIQCYLPY